MWWNSELDQDIKCQDRYAWICQNRFGDNVLKMYVWMWENIFNVNYFYTWDYFKGMMFHC